MMKKLLALLLALALLAGCSARNDAPSSPQAEEPAAPAVEEPDAGEVFDPASREVSDYLFPITFTGLAGTAQTWNDAEELDPLALTYMYGYMEVFNADIPEKELDWVENTPYYYVEQDIVEGYIQSYFDVSAGHLRQSGQYKPEREAYEYNMSGVGWAYSPQVLGWETNVGSDEIALYLDDGFGDPQGLGAVSMLVVKASPDGWRYLRCEYLGETTEQSPSLDELESLLYPIRYAYGALTATWDNPATIYAGEFVTMYGYAVVWQGNLDESQYEWEDNIPFYYADAGAVESYIASYFDVSPEHLRTSDWYIPDRGAYKYNMSGVGYSYYPEIIDWVKTGNTATLTINDGYDGEEAAAVLVVEVDENGLGHRYVSCEYLL